MKLPTQRYFHSHKTNSTLAIRPVTSFIFCTAPCTVFTINHPLTIEIVCATYAKSTSWFRASNARRKRGICLCMSMTMTKNKMRGCVWKMWKKQGGIVREQSVAEDQPSRTLQSSPARNCKSKMYFYTFSGWMSRVRVHVTRVNQYPTRYKLSMLAQASNSKLTHTFTYWRK